MPAIIMMITHIPMTMGIHFTDILILIMVTIMSLANTIMSLGNTMGLANIMREGNIIVKIKAIMF